MFTYKGFNIAEDKDDLKKTVDDFMESIVPTTTPAGGCKHIDAARIAIARAAACTMLIPRSINSKQQLHNLKRLQAIGFSVSSVFAPNRIQRKHLNTGSRLRNLMHGGILGALARQLTRDPTQQSHHPQWHQSRDALCVVQRASNSAGCAHVKWSIPEFQCTFNVGIKTYKPGQGPFSGLNEADTLAQFNGMNTADNRQAFLAECNAIACDANQSRVVQCMDADESAWKVRRPVVIDNAWITNCMTGFAKVCLAKMAAVSNADGGKLDRCKSLVDLYQFIAHVEWMFTDVNVRCVLNLNAFYQAHLHRLFHMTQQGIEHAAYMFGIHCPEMMTPELHIHVVPSAEFYMVPQMRIASDDAVFGPMKVACQEFMPGPVAAVAVTSVAAVASGRRLCDDSDSDDYYDQDDYDHY